MLNATIQNPHQRPYQRLEPNHRHRLPNLQAKLATNGPARSPLTQQQPVLHNGMVRLIMVIVAFLCLLAGSIYLIAGYAGAEIARAGHTIVTEKRTIIINSDVITAPANMIRYASQRRMVETKRLDLYMHWPSLEGYSEILKPAFNDTHDKSKVIFVSLIPRFSTMDMTARIKPIYQKFFISPAVEIGHGLTSRKLSPQAGFIDEALIVEKNNPYPYTARCMSGIDSETTPYCIRDIHIGKDLSLTYRFHRKLIADWLSLDRAIRNRFKAMIN